MTHRTETRVTYAETDAMGIVYYANYLRWFEVGRTELMRSLGIAYKEMEETGYLPAGFRGLLQVPCFRPVRRYFDHRNLRGLPQARQHTICISNFEKVRRNRTSYGFNPPRLRRPGRKDRQSSGHLEDKIEQLNRSLPDFFLAKPNTSCNKRSDRQFQSLSNQKAESRQGICFRKSTESLVAISCRLRVRSPFAGFFRGRLPKSESAGFPWINFWRGSGFFVQGKSNKKILGIPAIKS